MPSDILTPKTRTTEGDDLRSIKTFVITMMDRMSAGKKAHAGESTLDPVKEAMEECVDIANYAMIMYVRLSTLREKIERFD